MRLGTTLQWATMCVLAALGASSCSARDVPVEPGTLPADANHGAIQLGLEPVSGVTLSVVHYAVTNGATPPALIGEGDIPAPGTSNDINLGLSLPVGTGYRVSLSAASAEIGDNITCGAAYGPFDVLPHSVNSIQLVLSCHDDTNGSGTPDLEVVTDACPRLVFDYELATPPIGGVPFPTMQMQAQAHDLDGKAVSYAWSVSQPGAASFSPATGPTSQLTCNFGAVMKATITANNGDCTKSLSVSVSCLFDYGGSCENGVIDPGENCDTAIPLSKCPSDCSYVCGDGVAEAPAEDCDPGNSDNCSATCFFRTPVCGDGFLTTVGPNPEVCDGAKVPAGTPANKLCNATCTGFDTILGVCGNGTVEEGEQCDGAAPPFPSSIASPTCSNSCRLISTPACVACENAGDCFESVNNCLGGAAPFSINEQSQCFDVMGCIEASNCFDGTGTLGKCYCGSLSTTDCSAAPFSGPGSPDGACVAQIKAGFPTFSKNSQVLGGLTASDFPSGAAMKRLSCQKGANSSACLDTCGFTAGGSAFP